MEVLVKCNNVGISAFKVRKVADLIRGKKASTASRILRFNDKKKKSVLFYTSFLTVVLQLRQVKKTLILKTWLFPRFLLMRGKL